MKRTILTNSTGWFDAEQTIVFYEDTWWDGSNKVSRATGNRFDHEKLYYTWKRQWVLNRWSRWEGTMETYERIDADQAAKWLIRQDCLECNAFSWLPETVRTEIERHVREAEV